MKRLIWCGLAVAGMAVLAGCHSSGSPFTVTTTADTADLEPGDGVCVDAFGDCSLRAAVMEANAFPGVNRIELASERYVLSLPGTGEDAAETGDLDITEGVDIFGVDGTTIDGGGLDRVFDVHLSGFGAIDLQLVTITGGAADDGAALRAGNAGQVRMIGVEITDNTATAGAPLSSNGALISALVLTIADNTGTAAGALNMSNGPGSLIDTTISGNSASAGAGGVSVSGGSLSIEASTITANSGTTAGGLSRTGGTILVQGSIIGEQTLGADCAGAVTSDGYNVETDGSCAFAGTDDTQADPRLGTLADNGGPVRTHLPEPASPAIDRYPTGPGLCTLADDARLEPRPLGARCDTGAVETARRTDYDFTGDGKADRVWRESTGTYPGPTSEAWFIEGSDVPLWESSPGVYGPLPGDFDGDGVWEVAEVTEGFEWTTADGNSFVFAPAVTGGSNAALLFTQADYDGDGDTDLAYYFEATGEWQIMGEPELIQFGLAADPDRETNGNYCHDVPVPADYDGDGDDDIAVYNPCSGEWSIRGNPESIRLGEPGEFPAPADYDGDGDDEPATSGLSGVWRLVGSVPIPGAGEPPFGGGALPVPADYDGDGRADFASVSGSGPYVYGAPGMADLEIPELPVLAMRDWVVVNYVRLAFIQYQWAEGSFPSDEFDFDGDGSPDRVWTNSSDWWAEGDAAPFWQSPPEESVMAPGAYSYDNTWDAAVVLANGDWVTNGPAGTISFPLPESGSIDDFAIVQADYDADGLTDPAYWSLATGTWYILGEDPVQFGDTALNPGGGPPPVASTIGDVPVPADYDGDGDDDIAVYNPWTNEWRVHGSPDVVVLGSPGDWAAPADYDGDGQDEPAVVDHTTGEWTVHGGLTATIPIDALPVPASLLNNDGAEFGYLITNAGLGSDHHWVAPFWGLLDLGGPGFRQPAPVTHGFILAGVRSALIKQCWINGDCEWM